jgi:uncharacterized protein
MELCLVVDHACNLRCRYCYTGEKRSAAMSDDVIRSAIDWALRQSTGWLSITLFGGEPLLHPNILQTVERAVVETLAAHDTGTKLRWLLDTNATLFTDASLGWLATHKPSKVFVSLDGTAEAHDRHRMDTHGEPTHRRVVEGIRRLRERGIPFDIVAVVSPDTAHLLAQSLEFLLTLGAEQVQFQVNLRAEWSGSHLQAFAGHARGAAQVWAENFRQGRAAVVAPFHSKVLSHLFGELHLPSRCQIATREVAIAPSGRIYPCAEMVGEDQRDDFVIGHVGSGLDVTRVQQLRELVQRVHETCRECALKSRCLNGCGCRQLASTGHLGHIAASLCETENAWIDAADAVAEMLVTERCAPFLDFYYGQKWAVPSPSSEQTLVPLRARRRSG